MRELLSEHGHDVRLANSVEEALVSIQNLMPELVILDHAIEPSGWLLLPKLGRSLAIVCSEQQSTNERVTSLRLGADDFVGKPFDTLELLARITAVLRRSPAKPRERIQRIGELMIDLAQARVRVNDKIVPMTPTEFNLVRLFMEQPEQLLTVTQIGDTIWGAPEGITHIFQTHLYRIRRKFRAAGLTTPQIANVHNTGYRLTSKPASIPDEGETADA